MKSTVIRLVTGASGLMSNFHNAIQECARRLGGPHIAYQVWTTLLTDVERQQLGEFESQYRSGGAVGMWANAKSISTDLAIVELSRQFGLPDATYHWLRREMGLYTQDMHSPTPRWDKETSELLFENVVVKNIVRRANNIITVLNTFQECGWPPRVDNPLSGSSESDRLKDAVRRLNDGLKKIRFARDGTGRGVTWSIRG